MFASTDVNVMLEHMESSFNLPDELISRIITIGCESLQPLGSLMSPPISSEKFLLIDRDVRRKMKPLARKASHVCRRWHGIAHARSNYHLWITYLYLTGRNSMASVSLPEKDICAQVAEFKLSLDQSLGSDLSVSVTWDALQDLSRDIVNGLLTHAIVMLIPHQHQITQFHSFFDSLYTATIVYSILNRMANACQLEDLALHYMNGMSGDIYHIPEFSSVEHDLLDITTINEELHLERNLTSLRRVHICGTNIWYRLTLPETIIDITLMWTATARWSSLKYFLYRHQALRNAELGDLNITDWPSGLTTPNMQVSLPSLERLSFEADIVTAQALLLGADLPVLERLTCILRAPSTPNLHLRGHGDVKVMLE